MFLFESVPGAIVKGMKVTGDTLSFDIYGDKDVQMTFGLEPEGTYEVYIDDEFVGEMTTNLSGKLSVSAELSDDKAREVKVVKE
jgi:hypothetical protein